MCKNNDTNNRHNVRTKVQVWATLQLRVLRGLSDGQRVQCRATRHHFADGIVIQTKVAALEIVNFQTRQSRHGFDNLHQPCTE